ncbi:MAG: type II toxin-antitoxin system VapC family toxin [Cyanobacteria bacterium M_surface_7_m2_040]|nr:type II toxin-antitoxin system VapC family toxin [Cyanobacteria bacterium K_Offshore_0m_m2_072]MBM5800829.1 type II toxin-antitoxin system VapC family toxin [Cyanobacteria bacterium K_DeepCast_35m_m2_023]MBM5827909.1 type II toxin-antitoxin system VapC family toxin [Cyanobacteria bacterium M_surface_7_m2_040]
MILFCDTSALIKLLVDEAQSDQLRQISSTVGAIGVCRISWAEAMAALARLRRDDPVNDDDLEQARQHLIQAWQSFTIVEVSQPLVETAGRFADVFALRGYDSVQLAAAHELHSNAQQTVLFACYDRRLNQAAQLLQLEVLP